MTETHKAAVEALERIRQRIDDIKLNLDEVEKMFNKKALKHSFMDDNGFQVKHVHFKIDDWYKIADCLQFLWCNYDTIRNLMQPAAVKKFSDPAGADTPGDMCYQNGWNDCLDAINVLRITRAAATDEVGNGET